GLDSRLVRRRGGAFAPGAPPFATSSRSNCDLIAAILNPNRSFSATLAHESEITSKFALVFNKFAGTIARKGDAPSDGDGANGEPAPVAPDGDHGKNNSRRRQPRPGAERFGRPRRIRAEFGAQPLRSVPARTLLHARSGSKMARQTRCHAGARARAGEALTRRRAQPATFDHSRPPRRTAPVPIAGIRRRFDCPRGSQVRCRFISLLQCAGASTVS